MHFDKRGGVHVDWILSMGLFLVSTILLFAFLKPGIVPLTEEKILLDVLINNFNNNFLWSLKTTPYFVELCSGLRLPPGPGETPIGGKVGSLPGAGGGRDPGIMGGVITALLSYGKDSFFKFITGFQTRNGAGSTIGEEECSDGLDNDGDGAIDHPNDFSCSIPSDDDETEPRALCQNEIDDDGDQATDYPDDAGCNSPQDNSEGGGIGPEDAILSVSLTNNWEFSKLRYSDDSRNNEWVAFTGSINEIKIYCSKNAQNGNEDMIFHIERDDLARFLFTYHNDNSNLRETDISVTCSGACNYIGRLGSEEETRGINLGFLSGFKLGDGAQEFQNITLLKRRWGFPEENEFWIQGWRESDPNCGSLNAENCNYIVNYKTANPSGEDDVKVKDIKTFILRKDGSTEDVRIFFRAW
mgnify:CR=1 FL=1